MPAPAVPLAIAVPLGIVCSRVPALWNPLVLNNRDLEIASMKVSRRSGCCSKNGGNGWTVRGFGIVIVF